MKLFNFKKKEDTKSVSESKVGSNLQDNGFPKKEDKGVDPTHDVESAYKYAKNNELANSPANSIKAETPENTNKTTTKGDNKKPPMSYISVKNGVDEGTLVVRFKSEEEVELLTIYNYEFSFRKDFTHPDKPYRILGIGSHITVNEEELNYIYTRFKNIK